MARKSRVLYFDVLRVAATIAVIFIHVAAMEWRTASVESLDWQVFNFYDGLSRWGVPIFVMISGALFLAPDRKMTTKGLFSKNIVRILSALVFWSLAYVLFRYFVIGDIESLREACRRFVQGEYHLWFLFMIIGLYLLVPILRAFSGDRKVLKYFLVIALIFSFAIPTFVDIYKALQSFIDNEAIAYAATSFWGAYEKMHYHFTLEFVSYFLLGHYLATTNFKRNVRLLIYAAGIAGAIFVVLFSSFVALQLGRPYGFYINMSLPVMAVAVAIFVWLKQAVPGSTLRWSKDGGRLNTGEDQEGPETNLITRALVYVSNRSFGIYLVHIMVIKGIEHFTGLTTTSLFSPIAVPVYVLVVLGISLVISSVIHKIPFAGKYFV